MDENAEKDWFKGIIRSFRGTPLNEIKDFEPRYHTKKYLEVCSSGCGLSEKEIMERCGYAKLEKFRIHRNGWHTVTGEVPRKYLDVIGAQTEIIEYAVNLDQEDFDRALTLPITVRYYGIRYIPGIYGHEKLPEPMALEEATEFLKKQEDDHKLFINIPGLKFVEVHKGAAKESHYRPAVRFTKAWAIFSSDGSRTGTMRFR